MTTPTTPNAGGAPEPIPVPAPTPTPAPAPAPTPAPEAKAEAQPDAKPDPQQKQSLLGAAKAKSTDKGESGTKPSAAPITLKAPEGHPVIDSDAVSAFASLAQERGLSADQAQQVLDGFAPIVMQRLETQHTARVERWAEEAAAHPELGGAKLQENLSIARAAIDQFAPELLPLLESSGYGNRAEVLLAWYRVGKKMLGDVIVAPEAPSADDSPKIRIYDKSPELK